MKNISFLLFVLLSLFLLFGVNAATVSHPASEITPGTFPAGDFTFQGNVELQKNNEVFLNIKNTEASGRQYALVSSGSVGGIGVGKFSVYDKTANASRLTIDSSGNVGIGTASPSKKLDVAGDIQTSQGKAIASQNIYAIAAVVAGAYCQAKHGTNYNIAAVRRDKGSGSCASACLALFGGTYTGQGIGDLTCSIGVDSNGDVSYIGGRPNSGYVEADTAYCDWCCCGQY